VYNAKFWQTRALVGSTRVLEILHMSVHVHLIGVMLV